METKELHSYRKQLFSDSIRFKKTKRPALLCNAWTWKVHDEGARMSAFLHDYDLNEQIQVNFHKRYNFDAYCDGFGTRNPNAVAEALGGGYHVVNEETNSLVVLDHAIMEGDEYKEFAQDPNKFIWEKAFRRYNPNMTEEQFVNGMMAFLQYSQFAGHIKERMCNEFGVPIVSAAPLQPFEQIFNVYRGIKGVSIDLRRKPEGMMQLYDYFYETAVAPELNNALSGLNNECVTNMTMGLLGHTILNAEQFGEVYWPYLKRVIDALTEKNMTLYLFTEGTLERDGDYLRDVQQGVVMSHLEQDDIYEMRKRLPNICFAGGIHRATLSGGTPEQCVDEAKRLMDELGNGFVISSDKMLSFQDDCKRENLKAINDYILGLE